MSFPADKALGLLRNAHANNRLAHAYLITGPEGSGKLEIARQLICLVNGIDGTDERYQSLEGLKSGTVRVIGPESKSRRITIDGIRAAEMLPAASNAFLKTLEEPPENSMLLLLTAQPGQLLATILSRCIHIALQGDARGWRISDEARDFLDHLCDFSTKNRSGVSAALGLMKAFSTVLVREKTRIDKRNEEALKLEVKAYQKTTEGDWLKRREEYYKAVTESEYLDFRNKLIEYLVAWFGDALRQQNGWYQLDLPDYADSTGQVARLNKPAVLGRKMDAIETLRGNLNTNVQEALALESAFIQAFA
jgi:DNA polymerase-3 subunit delta'